MSENEEREPTTQPEGILEPPARKPPTAIGAGTSEPEGQPVREVVVTERTRVKDLAKLMHVPTRKVLWAAFNELGRLATVGQVLPFTESKALAAHFGYSARRPEGGEPGPRANPAT